MVNGTKLDKDDMDDFEEEDAPLPFPKKQSTSVALDKTSLTSRDSEASASETLMSSHAMKMGLYTINLGTKLGQKLHTAHMLILPLIPVFILLAQNTATFMQFVNDSEEILEVKSQVGNAVDLSILVQRLQEERASVALSAFLNRSNNLANMDDLQPFVLNKMDISRFTLLNTFNATDTVLKNVDVWPSIRLVTFFESKLTFQIQHSIFRTKIREGEKGIFEVLKWYNDINSFILDYISVSIKDSDVSDFYRYVIGFKNLLRSVEFGGKSSIYGYRYLAQGFLERRYMHDFVRYEMLRKEYLNQTFNFMPGVQAEYDKTTSGLFYEAAQDLITNKDSYKREGLNRTGEDSSLAATVDYFSQSLEHSTLVKKIVDDMARDIEVFVQKELERFNGHRTVPLVIIVILGIMVPVIIYVTYLSTTSMFTFSALYDERVEVYRQEKRKTEKLLTDLLPRQIIRQMKKGQIPAPESFESVSVFLCDIVGFTTLSSESTAHQIVDMLNSLYNMYDNRIDIYDVYKVETIGDAYMVCSGVPEKNDRHAGEIAKMALDLLAKLVTFEVAHKPGYRLRMRMGIHTGSCVAGVVGTKIPHYSVFGETVEIAGIMEASGEPMKIQLSTETKNHLKEIGGFNYMKRDTTSPKLPEGMITFWLIGLTADVGNAPTADAGDSKSEAKSG